MLVQLLLQVLQELLLCLLRLLLRLLLRERERQGASDRLLLCLLPSSPPSPRA